MRRSARPRRSPRRDSAQVPVGELAVGHCQLRRRVGPDEAEALEERPRSAFTRARGGDVRVHDRALGLELARPPPHRRRRRGTPGGAGPGRESPAAAISASSASRSSSHARGVRHLGRGIVEPPLRHRRRDRVGAPQPSRRRDQRVERPRVGARIEQRDVGLGEHAVGEQRREVGPRSPPRAGRGTSGSVSGASGSLPPFGVGSGRPRRRTGRPRRHAGEDRGGSPPPTTSRSRRGRPTTRRNRRRRPRDRRRSTTRRAGRPPRRALQPRRPGRTAARRRAGSPTAAATWLASPSRSSGTRRASAAARRAHLVERGERRLIEADRDLRVPPAMTRRSRRRRGHRLDEDELTRAAGTAGRARPR